MLKKTWNTILFIWAATLGAMVGLAACIFILLKEKIETKEPIVKQTNIFLANKKRAIIFYRFLSKVYDALNPFLYNDAMRREVVELASIRQGLRALDVGCGTGYTTEAILKWSAHGEVVGIDLTPQQLNKAVKKLKSRRDTLFLRGDAENLPFKKNTFNAVVSVGAIEYFPDPKRVIQEMARVVKPGGKVVVGGPELGWFRKLYLNRILYTPSMEELQAFYRGVGLKDVKTVLTGVDTFFGTDKYAIIVVGEK